LSIIKSSQLETILNYALQFRLNTKSNKFCRNGGTITKGAHTFGIGRAWIYRWLSRSKLSATNVKSRQRKLDWKELEKDVKQNPESSIVRHS
jgi:transposase